jgi:hypothetical protein
MEALSFTELLLYWAGVGQRWENPWFSAFGGGVVLPMFHVKQTAALR